MKIRFESQKGEETTSHQLDDRTFDRHGTAFINNNMRYSSANR